MKKILLSFTFLLFISCIKENASFQVMSFNIRYNNPGDGENAWPERKDIAAGMIQFHKADIIGMQEALAGQLTDLDRQLPGYLRCGVGRDDGKEAGEFMAVYYSGDRFSLLQNKTFWLSETPDKVSRGWDAACFRTVTVCKFKDKRTGRIFFLFNTHFDHQGQEARRESAFLLLKLVEEQGDGFPVLVTGDFNAEPDSEPIDIITGDGENTLKDARLMSRQAHHGPTGTWTGFKEIQAEHQIDYIFVKNAVQVLRHGFLSDTFDGRFPSDHLPVLAEVMIE